MQFRHRSNILFFTTLVVVSGTTQNASKPFPFIKRLFSAGCTETSRRSAYSQESMQVCRADWKTILLRWTERLVKFSDGGCPPGPAGGGATFDLKGCLHFHKDLFVSTGRMFTGSKHLLKLKQLWRLGLFFLIICTSKTNYLHFFPKDLFQNPIKFMYLFMPTSIEYKDLYVC